MNMKKTMAGLLTLAMTLTSVSIPSFAAPIEAAESVACEVAVGEATVGYQVVLPAGYDVDDENRNYPVLFVMPDNGIVGNAEVMTDAVNAALEAGAAPSSILVYPDFTEAMEAGAYAATKAIVADVDANFNTVATYAGRAVIGLNDGAYLAAATGYTNGNKAFNTGNPLIFGSVAMINGNFMGEENVWTASYGDIYTLLGGSSVSKFTSTISKRYYTYINSAADDANAMESHGGKDLVYGLLSRNSKGVCDVYLKEGTCTDFYVTESVAEALNGIGNKLVSGMTTGKLTLTPQAAYATGSVEGGFSVDVKSVYTNFCGPVESDIIISIEVTDPATGELLAPAIEKTFVGATGNYTNEEPIEIPNIINGLNSTISLYATVLGKKVLLDSKPLVRIAATGTAPEDQLIDLLGGWKFKATKTVTAGVFPTPEEYRSWEEVYPCLGWWDSEHSKVTNMKGYAGYAWYIKEFTIPADFPEGNYVVPVGFFDETDTVFINGVQIGATGLNPTTWKFSADKWDTERIYSINSKDLNIGGENVMIVLTYNRSGDGGWYDGHPGLYSPAAHNKLTAKPSTFASEADTKAVLSAVADIKAALEAKDIEAYASLVAPDFFQSGITKDGYVAKMAAKLAGEGEVTVVDEDALVFTANGLCYYQATRTMTDASGKTTTENISEFYRVTAGKAVLYGEHDRFFSMTIDSVYRAKALSSRNQTEPENFLVYLPEDYFETAAEGKRYPTAYFFHQLNSSSNSYAVDGVNKLMDEATAEGMFGGVIAIIPDSSSSSWWRNNWATMVTDELLPFADANFRTIDDARFRFALGCSMGGSGSYGIPLQNPNLFSGMISIFGATNMGANPITIVRSASAEHLAYYDHYLICGNHDMYSFGKPSIEISQILDKHGIDHYIEIEEGGHDSGFYLPYFKGAIAYQMNARPYITAEDAMSVLSGEIVNITNNAGVAEVTAKLNVSELVENYLNVVPATSYTKDTNPELVIPVTLNITKDGVILYSETKNITTKEAMEAEVYFEASHADIVPGAMISVTAALLNESVELVGTRKLEAPVTISVEEGPFIYKAKKIEPKVTVYCEGKVLKQDRDYKVIYVDNYNVGTATVIVATKGDYRDIRACATFEIIENPETPKKDAKPGKDKKKPVETEPETEEEVPTEETTEEAPTEEPTEEAPAEEVIVEEVLE